MRLRHPPFLGGLAMPRAHCAPVGSTVAVADCHTDTCSPQSSCERCDGPRTADGVCDTCVTCDRCHRPEFPDDTVHTVRGSSICADCRTEHYWQCEQCDGWNRDNDNCGTGCHTSDCDCYDCRDDDDDDCGGLVRYASYRPEPVFHGTGPLFLGPEIEIETPYQRGDECARLACSMLGELGYLKDDGSLHGGFEIVTHPMSYQWAMAHFPWQMLTRLDELGCETPSNTGIHVHVS